MSSLLLLLLFSRSTLHIVVVVVVVVVVQIINYLRDRRKAVFASSFASMLSAWMVEEVVVDKDRIVFKSVAAQ